MALSIIGTPAAVAATSITLPTHAVGDLIVIWAFRDGNTAVPTKPAASGNTPAWVDINAPTGANTCSARSAYFVATSTTHTSGTWTNATGMSAIVLRGAHPVPIGGTAQAGGTGANTQTAPAVTQKTTDGSSVLLEFYGNKTVTAWGSAPAGYTRQAAVSTEVCLNTKDSSTSDGTIVQTSTSTSSGWRAEQIEVLAAPTPTFTRVQAVGSGHGGSGGFGTQSVTLPGAVTAGDLLVCAWVGNSNVGPASCADNINGAWTAGTERTPFSGSGRRQNWFWKIATAGASAGAMTVTVTPNANAGNSEWMHVVEYSATNGFDSAVEAYGVHASGTAVSQASGTPTQAGDLILCMFASDAENTASASLVWPTTGFPTDAGKFANQPSPNYPIVIGELNGAGAAAATMAFGIGTGDDGGKYVIGFSPSTSSVLTKTQTGVSRIAKNVPKTQSAISRVANTIPKTQPAVSRIAKILTATQSAVSRIRKSVTLAQTAIAKIAVKTVQLTYDFVTQDNVNWDGWIPGTVDVSSGQLVIVPTTSYYAISAHTDWDFTNSQIVVQFVTVPNVGNGTTAMFLDIHDAGGTNKVQIFWSNNVIQMTETVASVDSSTTIAYSAVDMVWFRLREAGGTLYWETSPDGVSWTVRRTKSRAISDVTKMRPALVAGYWGTEPSPGTAVFDNFNLPPAGAIYTKTQGAISRIAKSVANAQSAVSRIAKSVIKTQTAISRIATKPTKTQSGISRIAKAVTKTQAAVSLVIQGTLIQYNRLTLSAQDVEASTGGWIAGTGAPTVTTSTDVSFNGIYALKVVATGSGHVTVRNPSNTLTVIPGQTNNLSAWVYAVTDIQFMAAGLEFYDSGMSLISTLKATNVNSIVNTWRNSVGSVVTPVGAAYAIPILDLANAEPGETFYFDRMFVADHFDATKTQAAISRIAKVLTKAQSATARLIGLVSKNQSATARIASTVQKQQSAISRVATKPTKTQSAASRIANIRTLTQSAKAFLYQPIIRTKTQTAIAKTVISRTSTISARARITVNAPTPPSDTTNSLIPPAVLAAILTSGATVVRRAEIYEEDGITPFVLDPELLSGSVTCSISRTERRNFEMSFANTDGRLDNYPGNFWYDKVIKVFRGIRYGVDKTIWEIQIGEFLIDNIKTQNFPVGVAVSGRDYMKKLINSKLPASTTFVAGASIEATIKTIALNGGITKFNLPTTGKTLGKDFTWDRGTERQQCINDIATAYGYEVFFDGRGFLVLREQRDPTTAPETMSFQTGGTTGNLGAINKTSSDAQIYNHVLVTGESSDTSVLPVSAEAINTAPTSPTRVSELGDRLYQYTSSFITTVPQAQAVADAFLKVHALESFELGLNSLVLPWIEGGDIARFTDPRPMPGDPNRYLITDFTIPLELALMSVTGKRITIVG